MNKPVAALFLASMAMVMFGPFGKDDLPKLTTIAKAQSAETHKRLSCPEGEFTQLEEKLAPGTTIPIHPGYAVSYNKARYLSENGKVTIDVCIVLRKFLEGEHAERQTIVMKGDTGTYEIYLQEQNLERVRR